MRGPPTPHVQWQETTIIMGRKKPKGKTLVEVLLTCPLKRDTPGVCDYNWSNIGFGREKARIIQQTLLKVAALIKVPLNESLGKTSGLRFLLASLFLFPHLMLTAVSQKGMYTT